MKRTTKYQLGYFEEGDITSSTIEMQRWETLDAQLYAMFSILGNGVLDGWNILPSSGLSIVVAPGSGHVNFVAVQSTSNTVVSGLTPSTRNYIYASLATTSYWDQSVSFVARVYLDYTNLLYLGYVDTDATTVTGVNTDGRTYLGFINLITSLIKEHRHIGGSDNPPPVNLASEVQGIINQNSLPDLDASIIQTGTIDPDRLPLIDHITKLINQGTLTHSQLDSFIGSLSLTNSTLMGETSTIDLLQLILALKHVYPDIDRYLVNEIAYIPGISPDNYVDWDNTTAIVDTRPYSEGGQHTITGLPAPSKNAYTYTWDSESEFESGTRYQTLIDGDQVSLATQENKLVIDEFGDLSQWEVVTDDLSSLSIALSQDTSTYVVPPNSAKLVIGDQTVEIALIIRKEFDAQDWSQYGRIVFFLKTESVQHGDVYFYINDSVAGTQNSHTKILDRNEPTVNIDTLQNGWQEITVDLSSYTRTNINTIGFYISSQKGWDTSKGFDLNIDNIYLTTGVVYKEDGYIRVIFGGDTFYDFWRLRWDAIIPSDSHSAGIVFKGRTRVGNSLSDLSQSAWSSYTSVSGSDISLPVPGLYKYIEIEMYFGASTDYTRSALLRDIFLDFYASDVEASFTYDTKDAWDSGSKFNIDTNTMVDSMLISNTEEVNDIIYGSNGAAYQLDDNLNQLYEITGSMLPRSTYQVLNNLSPSLGLITGVDRGNNGNIWLTDTDNDRVIEVNKSGQLVTGFYGSIISTFSDPYSSIVSNVTSTTTTLSLGSNLNILQAIYNSSDGTLYIVFDSDLENIYADGTKLDMDRIFLSIGTQRFYLNDSTVELLGVDEIKYNDWQALTSSTSDSAKFINQFSFVSHILKITLLDANKTLLNYMVDTLAPSIIVSSPYEQQVVGTSLTVKFLIYNFTLGTHAGENCIRVTLDGGTSQDIYATQVSFTGLSIGKHTLVAQLITNGVANTNIEAIATGDFIVYSGTYSLPIISLNTPHPNQIYSSNPIVIDFNIENFPILATGTHICYQVDSGSPINYYTEDPISISGLSAGKHVIRIFCVDKWNNELTGATYVYGNVTGTFIVGTNSLALTKLNVDSGAIYDSTMQVTNNTTIISVDVGNIYFENIYSPIDVRVIPCDTSVVNPSGLPSLVVAKLRSKSWTNGLSDTAHSVEFAKRIAASVNVASNVSSAVVTSAFSDIPTAELIFGNNYLDGHSVVQISAIDGTILMSNNAAVFARNKEEAKNILGSASKLGDNEFVIGDACNKRALITSTDLSTQKSQISWQYDSDRYVSDFNIMLQDNVKVSILDDSIGSSSTFIRQGTNIIWINNSVAPVSIYSGTTTYDDFYLDPDLTLYGDEFKSSVLRPGDRYSFKFVTCGDYNFFVYPSILIGSIRVTKNRISGMDQFILLENDSLEGPFSSRVIRIDNYGNVLWEFGNGLISKPRDARSLLNGHVLIST